MAAPGVPQPGSTPPPPPSGDATAALEPATPAPSRSRGKVIAASVGAVAVIAAGIFAITRFTSDRAEGGASSPEEAGLDMMTALENEDLLGVIDVLLPGERDTMRDPARKLVSELRRIEVLSGDADLSSVGGLDVVVEDVSVDVDETNVEDIALIRVNFEGTASVDGEALPIGDLILDNAEVERAALDVDAAPTTEVALPLVAVREEGRWYVSAFYSVAELARQQARPESEIPTEGVAPIGAESPEEAVDGMIQAVIELNLEGVVARLNPDEFEALQRYAPLFLDDAQRDLDEAVAEADVDIEVTGIEYDVTGDGDTRQVLPTAFTVEASAEGESATIELTDGCVLIDSDEQTVNTCELVDDLPELEDIFDDPQPVQNFLDQLEATFSDFDAPGIVVKEVDGGWYVSPMATGAAAMLSVVRALDRDEIENLQESFADAFEAVLDGSTVDIPDFDELPDLDDESADDDSDAGPPPTVSSVPVPSGPLPGSVPTSAGETCYAEREADAAAACFQDLIDAGDVDPIMVPAFLRFPECGLAEAYWGGEYFSLPDDEFIALVEPAVPCFEALLSTGEIEENELPIELSDFECLDGRNWYTAIEDTDYNAALQECAYG